MSLRLKHNRMRVVGYSENRIDIGPEKGGGGGGQYPWDEGQGCCWEGQASGVRFCSASMGVLATNASETMAYVWDGKRVEIRECGTEGRRDQREGFVSSRDAMSSWVGDVQRHARRRIDSMHSAFFPRRELVTPGMI